MKLPNIRPKVGLALSGGGTKGLAHIGVIKTLEQNNIPIDYIAGTSAGSIVGGLYAAGKTVSELEQIADNLNWWQIVKLLAEPSFRQGLIKGEKISQFLVKHIGNVKIQNLKIPFSAVATDLNTGKPIIINKGELIPAIRSSSAVPILLKPVAHTDETFLTDGGLSIPLPADTVKKMGADIVIAVNLYGHYKKTINPIEILIHNLSEINALSSNVIINPPVSNVQWNSILSQKERREVINSGAIATERKIPEIKRIIEGNKFNLLSFITSLLHRR